MKILGLVDQMWIPNLMLTMRALGRSMAWLLKPIEAGKKEGLKFPERESRDCTNFIR